MDFENEDLTEKKVEETISNQTINLDETEDSDKLVASNIEEINDLRDEIKTVNSDDLGISLDDAVFENSKIEIVEKTKPKIEDETETETEPKLELVKPSKSQVIEDEEDEEDVEETVMERLVGLTEMFPDFVRNSTYSIATTTIPAIKKTYNFSRYISWIFFSSLVILVIPVCLEKERCQAQRELSRQMLLGPGNQSSSNGLAPPPSVSR